VNLFTKKFVVAYLEYSHSLDSLMNKHTSLKTEIVRWLEETKENVDKVVKLTAMCGQIIEYVDEMLACRP
jgi:hypothetical protein